ncbi:hypothetical protein CTI12_AA435720 [Artemisia annua]|uniref:Uncharacterized protein n=1 Tax=Artemisia annua TaxID=35608 RepID=A0A2U1LYZ2_ARTAN|nr:hypothetical protein CTI12_AA435720 [Artemisia annua]
MGQVKLLKRGEVLEDTLTKHHSKGFNEVMVSCEKALPTKKKVERMSRKAEVTKAKKDDVLSSTNSRLGPNPKIVSKELTECFAGFGFPSSPHPSSLPLPGFSVRNP